VKQRAHKKSALYVVIFALVGLTSGRSFADEGRVVSVHDGDTLTVLVGKQQVKVRLADIDAPELRQPYGGRSKESLAALCFQEAAKLVQTARDRYGRAVGRVECAGMDASVHQVATGMAWVFPRYAPKDSPLYRLEAEAKLARRGLWEDSGAVPPWEWRRSGKSGKVEASFQ
jgi:endonuclease YncB( thermonuclease family)